MLKKELNILEKIKNEAVVESTKKIYFQDNFIFAINDYRMLGKGTIPNNIEIISRILKDILIDVKPKECINIVPKEVFKVIKENLRTNKLSLRYDIMVILKCDNNKLQIKTWSKNIYENDIELYLGTIKKIILIIFLK